jgi:hypothetical protein
MAELVGDVARRHPGEACHRIGDALDEPQRRRRNAQHRQKARQDHGGGLVAKIAERAGDPGACDGAVHPPVRLGRGVMLGGFFPGLRCHRINSPRLFLPAFIMLWVGVVSFAC